MTALAAIDHPEYVDARADEFWLQMQVFVNCSANVSRLLWSQKGKFAAERADLRLTLSVLDDSPVRETIIRNDLEHMDERIRTWSQLPGHRLHGDRLIGMAIDRAYPLEKAIPWKDIFRAYDPETGDLLFWGNRLNVHLVEAELRRIRDRANHVRLGNVEQ